MLEKYVLKKEGIIKDKDEAEDITDPELKERVQKLRELYNSVKNEQTPVVDTSGIVSWMKDQPFFTLLKTVVIFICHALAAYAININATAEIPLLLALMAFVVKLSNSQMIIFLRTASPKDLLNELLLMNEFTIIVLGIAYYFTKMIPYCSTYIVLMICFSYIEDTKSFPKVLFKWLLLIFVLIQTYLYIRVSANDLMILPVKIMVIWGYFLLKLAVF